MREIIQVMPREDYRLEITFDEGKNVIVDVKPLMTRRIFRSLRDYDRFAQVEVDRKFGGVQWPNGADICMDWIEAQIESEEPLVKSIVPRVENCGNFDPPLTPPIKGGE
ncbi:MAG: DUF2442 domain-containing protein [Thermodesulfobacteriota bacterium]